ncbi:hypothetical protein HN865_04810 [Candidatus Woesearchaeota archaeon]|jgi:hypothetical protein|nr:hypothetical protein [archaeon]MBT7238144.1 hypothetical protein [Candidatus Woesearchaeota archaeon]
MKARKHLAIGFFIVLVLFVLLNFYDKEAVLLSLFSNLFNGETNILWIGISLFLLGAIFPDIDSNDDGSYIFHTFLKPLAKFVKSIFKPFIEINHKGFLHTISGIALSSLIVVILTTIIYFLLISNNFSILAFFFWFILLFIGQFLHLVEDKIKDPEWELKIN